MASLRGARRATKQSRAAGAVRVALDCFASLAMTNKKAAAEIVRGGFSNIIVMKGSVLSLAGLAATYSSKS
jgi:hypothetical protein